MIITVGPDDWQIVLPDFKLRGYINIYDAVGNQVLDRSKMLWWQAQKCLIFIWNGKNSNDRNVGPGMYLALFEIEEITESLGYENGGPKDVKRLYVGVSE